MIIAMLLEALTPLGFRVRTTPSYWELIVTVKHPIMYGRERDVADVLRFPDEIRRSRSDPSVYLFYRVELPGRWTCVEVKQLADDAFVVTAYPTDAVKEGERVWTR
jgi:hypothetical protein